MWTSLHLLVICTSSLVRCLLRCLAYFLIRLFVFSLLRLKSSLYILDNSSLSDVFFASIFSHHMAFLFILLSVFCGEHKSLILVKFSLSIIFFMDNAFSVVSKNPLPYPTSSRFFFWYKTSRSFIILWFILCSVIHFINKPRFLFLLVDVQLFQNPLLKRLFSLLCCPCSSVKDQLAILIALLMWIYPGFSVWFHWSICIFFHQYHTALITVADLILKQFIKNSYLKKNIYHLFKPIS